MSSLKEEWGEFRQKLEKKKEFMEKFYFVFLVVNILYLTMLTTPMIGNFVAWLGGMMPWLPVEQGIIIFSGIFNLRLLIGIPAAYAIAVEMQSARERICAGIMLFAGWLSALFLREWNDTYLLTAALMIVASYGKDFKKIARLSIVTITGVMVLSALLVFAGVIPEYNLERNGRIRHSLGVFGPTGLAGHMYAVLITLIFLRNGLLKWMDYLLILVLSVLNIVFVDGRIAFICIMLATCGSILYSIYMRKGIQLSDKIVGSFRYLLKYVYLIVAGVFYFAVFTYPGGSGFYNLSSLLGSFAGRVEVPHRIMQQLPFSFWGNYMQKFGEAERTFIQEGQYNFLDSSYARMYLIYGLAGLIFCLALFTAIQNRLQKEKKGFAMFLLAIVAFFFLVQKGILDPGYNVFPMLLWARLDGMAPPETIDQGE